MKIPWKSVVKTAWEWARIIWQAKHPTDKPPTPPVVPALLLVAALATLAPPCRAQGPDSINSDSVRPTRADDSEPARALPHQADGAGLGAHL